MVPSTLLGLLVVAASIGPGYLFVRVAEKRNPRPERSAILELAELVSVGGLSSALALLVGLLVSERTGWVDLHALAKNGSRYVLEHPGHGLGFFLSVLGASYAGAGLSALLVNKGLPASLARHSAWHELLSSDGGTREVFATIELKDGRVVAGFVRFYTVEQAARDEREIVLGQPLSARTKGASTYVPVEDNLIALSAADIAALSVKYIRN